MRNSEFRHFAVRRSVEELFGPFLLQRVGFYSVDFGPVSEANVFKGGGKQVQVLIGRKLFTWGENQAGPRRLCT